MVSDASLYVKTLKYLTAQYIFGTMECVVQ
jgi:hypothetical protein